MVELSDKLTVPTVSLKPFAAPVPNVPPFKIKLLLLLILSAAPSCSVPVVIVVVPVYVFAPESAHVPEPILVSVPAPVPIILDTLPLPVPPRVSPKPDPVMVPGFVILISPLVMILLELPSVINPLYDAPVPELFIKAPLFETPVPLIVSASAVESVIPFRSSAAPLLTLVPPPVVPNGVFPPLPAAPSFNIPPFSIVVVLV